MRLTVCKHCNKRVLPMSDGSCPACRRALAALQTENVPRRSSSRNGSLGPSYSLCLEPRRAARAATLEGPVQRDHHVSERKTA